jgi:hypothetical protein
LAETIRANTRSLDRPSLRLIGPPLKSIAAIPAIVCVCSRRYLKAGCDMLSNPRPWLDRPMSTTSPGVRMPAPGARSSASARLKIVLLAAMPSASEARAVTV